MIHSPMPHFHCVILSMLVNYVVAMFSFYTIDPEEVLNLLFKHVLHLDPFIAIRYVTNAHTH